MHGRPDRKPSFRRQGRQHPRRAAAESRRTPRPLPPRARHLPARPVAEQDGVPGRKKILRRGDGWPLDRFAVIEPAWRGATVACIAGGPSLTPAQVEACRERGLAVVAVNDAYLLAPWADVCYFADCRWWGWHRERAEFKAFAGQKCSIEANYGSCAQALIEAFEAEVESGALYWLRRFENMPQRPGARRGLATGGNSGQQAVNIAILAGAARILLLGYDMKLGPGGREHWFGNHPIPTQVAYFSTMIGGFRRLARDIEGLGIDIINCSPDSALDCFRKEPLEQALARCVE